jgi:hypothetical protein
MTRLASSWHGPVRQVAHPNVQAFYASAATDAAKACIAAKLAPSACTLNSKQTGVVALMLVWNQNLWTKYGHKTDACRNSQALPPLPKKKCVDVNLYPNGKSFAFASALGSTNSVPPTSEDRVFS